MSAFFYFAAMAISLLTFFRLKRKKHFSLFYAAFSLLCFCEETSYLGHYINYSIPYINNLNVQNEVNLHNLPFFHGGSLRYSSFSIGLLFKAQNLFRISFCFYFFCIPLLAKNKFLSIFLEKIGYVLVRNSFQISLFVTLIINVFVTLFYAYSYQTSDPILNSIAEVREMTYSVYIFTYALSHIFLNKNIPVNRN